MRDEGQLHPADANRFGLSAEDVPPDQLNLLPQLMDAADLYAVVLSAWDRTLTDTQVDRHQSYLDHLLHQLLGRRRRITFSFYPLPDQLARDSDTSASAPMEMFNKPQETWLAFLTPVLMRHAQRVTRWQLGPTGDQGAFFDARLRQNLTSIKTMLENLAPQPVMVLPWRLNQQRRTDVPPDVAYAVSTSQTELAGRLGRYLNEWTQSPPTDVTVVIEVPPATRLNHERRITDTVLRMLHVWEASGDANLSLQLLRPWTVSADRDRTLLPDPVLGAFSGVAHRLAGRKAVGRLTIEHGLESIIFDGPAGGMLAAWNRSAAADDAVIDMYLGEEPVAIDIWGNRQPIEEVDGRHKVALAQLPIFIEGIDPELALFRTAFRIDPPFVESKQTTHPRKITLANPWSRTISGYMIITGPTAWTIRPQRTFFSISAGESRTFDTALRFPASEVAGRKKLTARFEIAGPREYRIDASTRMELGLPDVEFDANLTLAPNNKTGKLDALITCTISNVGDKPVSLRAFAVMAGQARQMKPVSGLKPAQSVLKHFRFEDVASVIQTTNIRVGLRELAGPAVLNHILTAGDL